MQEDELGIQNQGIQQHKPKVGVVKSIQELQFEKDSLLFLDIDDTCIFVDKKVSKRTATPEMFALNNIFLEKVRAAKGDEAFKAFEDARNSNPILTEEGLVQFFENQSKNGVYIILITNRSARRIPKIDSDLQKAGYKFSEWRQVKSRLPDIEKIGDHTMQKGVIYPLPKEKREIHPLPKKASKGVTLKAIAETFLKEIKFFTRAHFIDNEGEHIYSAMEQNPTFPIPFDVYHYRTEMMFNSPEKIKVFYKDTISNFGEYEVYFNEAFNLVS